MKLRVAVVVALACALVLYLVKYVGLGAVLAAATSVGWGGFALLCVYALALFAGLLGPAWWVLVPRSAGARLRDLIWARLVRDSVAEVLPLSQLGGMALGARAAILQGIPSPLAAASLIVDVTTEMLAQIAFIAVGVLILSLRASQATAVRSLTTLFATGLTLAVLAAAAFLVMQRYGHHWAARTLARRFFPGSTAVTAPVNASLDGIYGSRVRIAASVALHFGGWTASAAGTWIAFRLVGAQVSLISVLAIESLVCAIRSAAFVVPNALGVQEAAYAVLASLFGVGQELGLAVSLVRRARDITIGAPVLLIWQAKEGRRAIAAKPTGKGTPDGS